MKTDHAQARTYGNSSLLNLDHAKSISFPRAPLLDHVDQHSIVRATLRSHPARTAHWMFDQGLISLSADLDMLDS
ncbi:hypothetical protein [Sinorhizobium psoraleae]|uniref:Uncharacterized protein n=1 Tax=Sinorhizobium psoraleae TaxID=520838 RepID=A0ABT4KP33_9HYPH|nr:hypothetical protein [Sinorhizobium psoraleae]MCZ4093540.1 hypothetical protein [Sinorhizobium psoraleae]